MQFYCDHQYTDGKPCLATFPCYMHTNMDELLSDFTSKPPLPPVVLDTEEIRVIYVIPLPCGHNYPEPVDKTKFIAKCDYCDAQFWTEMKPDVCELTRIS